MPLFALLLLFGTLLALSFIESAPNAQLAVAASGVSVSSALRRGRGRPRKFKVPSRAVTLTLPEAVLSTLASVHSDLSRAIVHLAQRVTSHTKPLAELSVFGQQAVITVRSTPSLEQHAGVHLVPLPDGRALISFERSQTIAELELTLQDALEDSSLPETDRAVFKAISAILREARRSRDVTVSPRNIIVIERHAGNGRKTSSSSERD